MFALDNLKDDMDNINQTSVSDFLLLGLSGYPTIEIIFFAVILVMYLMILIGNGVLIVASILDSRLHTPMYFFLGNLSFLYLLYILFSSLNFGELNHKEKKHFLLRLCSADVLWLCNGIHRMFASWCDGF